MQNGSRARIFEFGHGQDYQGTKAVIETAGPSGATLQLLTEARDKMEIDQPDPPEDKSQGRVRQAAARCWAMLLARIYECLPLTCPKCGQPMRLIAFIMAPPVVEKMELLHNPAKAMTFACRRANRTTGGPTGSGSTSD